MKEFTLSKLVLTEFWFPKFGQKAISKTIHQKNIQLLTYMFDIIAIIPQMLMCKGITAAD